MVKISTKTNNELVDISEKGFPYEVCGFLLVLPAGQKYESLNYKWFSGKFSDFAYILSLIHI